MSPGIVGHGYLSMTVDIKEAKRNRNCHGKDRKILLRNKSTVFYVLYIGLFHGMKITFLNIPKAPDAE